MSQEIITCLVASVVAIIGALTSFAVNYLENKSTKADIKNIKESLKASTGLYVKCPNCSTKIYLSKVDIEEE